MTDVAVEFIHILSTVLAFAIIIRALMSWFMPGDGSGIMRVLFDITEPVLAPIRRVLPPVGGIDFSPIVGIVLVQLIGALLVDLLQTAV